MSCYYRNAIKFQEFQIEKYSTLAARDPNFKYCLKSSRIALIALQTIQQLDLHKSVVALVEETK